MVLSIDWLSVKLRTFDNLYVRIPNETLIKALEVKNRVLEEIKETFQQHQIDIPIRPITIYQAPLSEPLATLMERESNRPENSNIR